MLDEFRLYVVAMATVPAADGTTGFLGSTSFSLEDISTQSGASAENEGQRPRWWWLFSQEMGLHRNAPVEMMIVNSDPRTAEPDVTLSGRSDALPNSNINGTYGWQSDVWNGRPTYKHERPATPLYIFYDAQQKWWAVSDFIGDTAPYAISESASGTPDRSESAWNVLDAQKRYVRGADLAPDGNYAEDLRVECSQTSMLQFMKPKSGGPEKSVRSAKILAMLKSLASVDKQLEIVLDAAQLLQGTLEPGTHTLIFAGVKEIGRGNYVFLDSLVQAQAVDENFNAPLTALFTTALEMLKDPFLVYCKGLSQKVALLKDMFASDPKMREKLQRPDRLLKAFEGPFLQVQRLPHFIQAIMFASREDPRLGPQQDGSGLANVLNGFKGLQVEVMAAAMGASSVSLAEKGPPEVSRNPSQPIGAIKYIEVSKGKDGSLGLKTESNPVGFFVGSVKPGSVADRSGGLVEGMRIFAVNGADVEKLESKQRVGLLKEARTVQFKCQYDPIGRAAGQELHPQTGHTWFHGMLSQTDTKRLLEGEAEGNYLVRQCPEKPRSFEIAISTSAGVEHREIVREPDGLFTVEKWNTGFTMLESLGAIVDTLLTGNSTGWHQPDLALAVKRGTKVPPKRKAENAAGTVGRGSGGGRGRGRGRGRGAVAGGGRGGGGGGGADNSAANEGPVTMSIARNDGEKIGLLFTGEAGKGTFIKRVKSGSPASAGDVLKSGMQVMELAGTNTEAFSKEQCNDLMKEATGDFVIVAQFDPVGFAHYDGGKLADSLGIDLSATANEGVAIAEGAYGVVQAFDSGGNVGNHAQVDEMYLAMDVPATFTLAIESPMGLSFKSDDRGYFVSKVKPEGNAIKAGVVANLRMISINGAPIAGFDKTEVTNMIKASEGPVSIAFVDEAKAASNAGADEGPDPFFGFEVTVPSPLGMSFKQDEKGYVVTKVKPEGNAEASGVIKVDFRILEVEGASIDGLDKPTVTNMIKEASAAKSSCTLKFKDPAAKKRKKKKSGKASGKASGKDSGKGSGKASGKAKANEPFALNIPSPLGMSFKQDEKGYVVTKVKEGGNAEGTGKIKVDFRILEVEGAPVEGLDKPTVTNMIKEASAMNSSCTIKFLDPTKKKSGKKAGAKKSGKKSGKDSGKTAAAAAPSAADQYEEVSPAAPPNGAASGVLSLTIPSPLGLSFKQDEKGFVVTKVKEGGNTEKTGQVKPDFRITAINGTQCAGMDKAAVTDLIKAASAAEGKVTVGFVDPNASAAPPKAKAKKASGGTKKKKKASTKAGPTLVKINIPLGMGFKDEAGKFMVTKVKEGGNAEATGKVKVGMEIVTVNGKVVAGMDKTGLAALIKSSNEVCEVGFKAAKKTKKSVKGGGGDNSGPKQWNAMNLDKQGALALIKGKPPGAFCMRATERGYATVSIIRPDGTLLQKVIVQEANGFCFKGSANRFASDQKLIEHYASDAQNELPCKLLEVY